MSITLEFNCTLSTNTEFRYFPMMSSAFHGSYNNAYPSPARPEAIMLDQTSKPQCFDHGCNGREFSTTNELLRHQRDELSTAATIYGEEYRYQYSTARESNIHNEISEPIQSPYHSWTSWKSSYGTTGVTPENIELERGPPVPEMKLDNVFFDASPEMNFGASDSGDVLQEFDFDSFLKDKKDDENQKATSDEDSAIYEASVVLSPPTPVLNPPQRVSSILAGDRGSETENTDQLEKWYSPARNIMNMRDYSSERNTSSYATYLEARGPLNHRNEVDVDDKKIVRHKTRSTQRLTETLSGEITPDVKRGDSSLTDTYLIGVGGHETLIEKGTKEWKEIDTDFQEQTSTELVEKPDNMTTDGRLQIGESAENGDSRERGEFEEQRENEEPDTGSGDLNNLPTYVRNSASVQETRRCSWDRRSYGSSINQIPNSQLPYLALDHSPQTVISQPSPSNNEEEVSRGKRKREEETQKLESIVRSTQQAHDEGTSISEFSQEGHTQEVQLTSSRMVQDGRRVRRQSRLETEVDLGGEDRKIKDVVVEESLDSAQTESLDSAETESLDSAQTESLDSAQTESLDSAQTVEARSSPISLQPLRRKRTKGKLIKISFTEPQYFHSASIDEKKNTSAQDSFKHGNIGLAVEERDTNQEALSIPDIQLDASDRPAAWIKYDSLDIHFDAQELNATAEERSRAKGELFQLLRQWTTCDPSTWTAGIQVA